MGKGSKSAGEGSKVKYRRYVSDSIINDKIWFELFYYLFIIISSEVEGVKYFLRYLKMIYDKGFWWFII